MNSEAPTSSIAPATCEGCGSVLVISEEHPDKGVIYCTCSCIGEADRTNKDRSREKTVDSGKASLPPAPPSAVDAGPPKSTHRCVSCGAVLIAVGPRPDGSPAIAECPCGRPQRPHQERRATVREAPKSVPRVDRVRPIVRPAPPSSGGRKLVMLGAVSLMLVAGLAGYWAHGRGATTAPVVTKAPDSAAPPLRMNGDVEVRNDASGSVTLVSGDDPNAVFRAFCRHPQFKSALVPGEIQPTTPPDPDRLLGSAILMDGVGTPHHVILKRDPKTKRWSIGDGTSAIVIGKPAGPASPVTAAK